MGEQIISERELEEYICLHPERIRPRLEIIGSQIQLPHGRLDVLGWMPPHDYMAGSLCVFELKAVTIREKDIAQATRYRMDIISTLQDLSFRISGYEEAGFVWDTLSESTRLAMIGPQIADKARVLATHLEIDVYLYSVNTHGIAFTPDVALDRSPYDEYAKRSWAHISYRRLLSEARRREARRAELNREES